MVEKEGLKKDKETWSILDQQKHNSSFLGGASTTSRILSWEWDKERPVFSSRYQFKHKNASKYPSYPMN